jgi:hypothetical protein
VVGVESDLLDVERLGSVDIGDRHSDKLEFHLHDWTLTVPTDTVGCTLHEASSVRWVLFWQQAHTFHQAIEPPSAVITAPLTLLASSVLSHEIRAAISSACAIRTALAKDFSRRWYAH